MALGGANFETEWGVGRKVTYEKDRDLADLLVRLVRETARGDFDTRAIMVPEGVVMSVCRLDAGESGEEPGDREHRQERDGRAPEEVGALDLDRDEQQHEPPQDQ